MKEVTLYNLVQRYDFVSNALQTANDDQIKLLERKKEETRESIMKILIENKENSILNLIS